MLSFLSSPLERDSLFEFETLKDQISIMKKLWGQVLEQIKEQVSESSFDTWIKPIKPKREEEDCLILEVPNNFFRDWIKDNYWDILQEIIRETYHVSEIKIEVKRGGWAIFPKEEKIINIDKERIKKALENFNPRYTFENFVVGEGNQFAHAASVAVAQDPGLKYNPLFIYGGTGLGKTHLLNAIGHRIILQGRINDPMKVCYISAEEFTNELINAIRYERTDQFRRKFRNIDVLLIDDIHFLTGKERTQTEFFHTFNTLYEAKKQIVLTSDKFPREIPDIEERLRSRFEWGLIADIQPPDIETKVAILRKKAEIENIDLPDDVAFFLASHIDSNIRTLEGCLIRLGAFASLTKKEITIEMAKDVLKHIIKEKKAFLSVEDIQDVVTDFFNLKPKELKSKRRLHNLVFPRQVAMYLSKRLTSASLVEIGMKFGGKDHSTVLYSIKKIEERLEKDPNLRKMIEQIEEKIRYS